jgi:hypothetical protein
MKTRDRGVIIEMDLDRQRLIELVSEALRIIYEFIEGEYIFTKDEVLGQLDRILSTNRVSVPFVLNVGSKKIPDLELKVEPRRKRLLCKTSFKKKIAPVNQILRTMK